MCVTNKINSWVTIDKQQEERSVYTQCLWPKKVYISNKFQIQNVENLNYGNRILTSRRNVETAWRVFSDIHLTRMFRICIRDLGVLNISYDNGIAVSIQEGFAFRISA